MVLFYQSIKNEISQDFKKQGCVRCTERWFRIMKLNKKTVEKILTILQESVWGMTIEEIAEKTGHHRNTIAKYMPILEENRLVVSRTIGKYTFWLLRAAFEYRKSNIATEFFRKLARIVEEYVDKNEILTPFRLGELLGYELTNLENNECPSEKMLSIEEIESKTNEFLGIFLPTILPRISFRINEISLDEPRFTISVANCPCQGNPRYKSSCIFIMGYIKGVVEKVGFTVVDINEVSCQIDGFPACTYEVTLDKSIRKYLEQFIEKRKK